jgi:hypothetical protein
MDEEFNTVFTIMGWENFWKLADQPGSKILTLEFLSMVQPSKNDIYFHLMNQEYNLTWPHFSHILGFAPNCTPELEHATHGYNRLEFWHEITSNNECHYPRTNDIQNPTLRFMHHCIGVTLFPRDDVRIVRHIDLRLLFAVVNKIRVSPIKGIVAHWMPAHNRMGPFDFTSIITKIACELWLLHEYPHFLTTPRTMLTLDYFNHAHIIESGKNDDPIVYMFHGHPARITLPCERLKLYGGRRLTMNLDKIAGHRSFAGQRITRSMAQTAQQGGTSREAEDSDWEENSSAMQISSSGARRQ